MDSFTIAVVIGGAVVLLIFGALFLLDKGGAPVASSEPKKSQRA